MAQFRRKTHRAREALIQTGRDYPDAWKAADNFRRSHGQAGFEWPAWCYLPLAAAYAVVSGGGSNRVSPHQVADVARVGAMMAWRMTQGIYRFDAAVYEAVRETDIAGDVPTEILFRLPEWCVYVETPDMETEAGQIHGFWAHMEHDMRSGQPELRLLLDMDAVLLPVPLHVGQWSLTEAIAKASDLAAVHAISVGMPHPDAKFRAIVRTWSEPLVSLLLYLCSTADYSRRGIPGQPANPEPKRTRRNGWRLFPASGPTEWDVGVRMGAALRAAYQREQMGDAAAPTGRQVRPHVRRAHWHTFLSGPRLRDGESIPPTERRRDLRWVPPIPVNIDDVSKLPTVIRRVECAAAI